MVKDISILALIALATWAVVIRTSALATFVFDPAVK